jgi:hypothetical protein
MKQYNTSAIILPESLQGVRKQVVVKTKGLPPRSFFDGSKRRKIRYSLKFGRTA